MKDLIAKLEAAEVGSRELDCLVWLEVAKPKGCEIAQGSAKHAVGCEYTPNRSPSCTCGADHYNWGAPWARGVAYGSVENTPFREAKHYTTNYDDSIAIIDDGLPFSIDRTIPTGDGRPAYRAAVGSTGKSVWHSSGQLALCIAALRTRGDAE